MNLPARLHALLVDGKFHSGEDLATELGVSRSAVWKAAVTLRSLGVVIHAVRNRGYRLASPSEPLHADRIREALRPEARDRVRGIDVEWTLPSTNAVLLARADLAMGQSDVCLAEYQTEGRGRRGRKWFAPPGAAICLSLSWHFPSVPRDVGALSLVVGVCAMRALQAQGVQGVQLKWPNDLQIEQEKLGGILIEMRAESAGPAYIVIGIGLNVALSPGIKKTIAETGTQATDLRSAGLVDLSRNGVVAGLVSTIVTGLREFDTDGLVPFLEEFRVADALHSRPVSVHIGGQLIRGIARGVDIGGALLVETPEGLRKFVSGEVSVRPDH